MLRITTVLLCLATAALFASPGAAAPDSASLGFKRAINPQWFPDDPRQWSTYDQSVLLTDLSQVESRAALVTGRREKRKWKVLPFAAGELKGSALSCYAHTDPPPVHLRLGQQGWHAVYVALSTVSGGITTTQPSGIQARLRGAPVFRRMHNNMRLTATRADVIQEQFLTIANLQPADAIEFAPLPNLAATVAYVRLVPLAERERLAWQEDAANPRFRSNVATFDGHSWIWPYAPKTANDLLATFEGFQSTDFREWWFGVTGADLVNYPTKVGTIPGASTLDFPTREHEAFTKSLLGLLQNGVNPLRVARDAARAQGRSFHVFLRPAAWGASIPFEETFDSKFFHDHPEWRAVDREGRRTLHMSWAVPEVRQQTLAIFRETVEMVDPDGVGLFFNRGMPLMLWEEAFAARFRQEYGLGLAGVEAEDARIHRLRGKIMTEYLRDLRRMLGEIARTRDRGRYAVSVAVLSEKRLNDRFGLDVETWVREGLVDQISIPPAHHTKYEPPDLPYFRQVLAGTKVKLLPFVVAWRTTLWNAGKPADLCKMILKWYDDGADGIAVWDPAVEKGYGRDAYQGQPLDVLGHAGHRELLAHWAKHGVPLPHTCLVTRLGENEYSPWYPNTGY